MNHPCFPYNLTTLDTTNTHALSKYWNGFIQWLVNSCSYTFSMYRSFYKNVLGMLFMLLTYDDPYHILSTIIFYVSPIIVLLMSFMPWMIPVGFILSLAGGVLGKNYNDGIFWLCAPITVFVFGIFEVIQSPSTLFNFTLILILIFKYFTSWFVLPIAFIWYWLISIALWIYAILFFICSPLTQEGGIQRIKESIGLHWKGLTILFLGLVTKSALAHLSSTLFTGVIVGCIISLFLLYKA